MRLVWIRWILRVANFLFGLALVFPGPSLASNPAYTLETPEYIWGSILMVLSGLVILQDKEFIRLIFHGFCSCFWNYLIFLIFAGSDSLNETLFLIAIPFVVLSLFHLGEFIHAYSNLRGNNGL
jgi:hypothetical protein